MQLLAYFMDKTGFASSMLPAQYSKNNLIYSLETSIRLATQFVDFQES